MPKTIKTKFKLSKEEKEALKVYTELLEAGIVEQITGETYLNIDENKTESQQTISQTETDK